MRIIPNTWQPQARSKKILSTHTPRTKEMTAFKTRIRKIPTFFTSPSV